MLTPSSLKAFSTALARLLTCVTSWRTSGRAKGNGASSTPASTSPRFSSTGEVGRLLRGLQDSPTPSTPTTSASTSPGGSIASPTPEAAPDGLTAGGLGMSRDCCREAMPIQWQVLIGERPGMRFELAWQCPVHGRVLWWRPSKVEAMN